MHSDECSTYKCNNTSLSKKVKYLGLLFDEHFSWTYQIEYLAKRLRTVSAVIYRLRSVCSIALRRTIYKALDESILRYGATVFGWAAQYKLKVLNTILYKITRNIAYGTDKNDNEIAELMRQHSILNIQKLVLNIVLTKHFFRSELEKKKIQ